MQNDTAQAMEQLFDIPALKKLLSNALEDKSFKALPAWKQALVFIVASYAIGFLVYHLKMREIQNNIDAVFHPFSGKKSRSRTYPVEIRRV